MGYQGCVLLDMEQHGKAKGTPIIVIMDAGKRDSTFGGKHMGVFVF